MHVVRRWLDGRRGDVGLPAAIGVLGTVEIVGLRPAGMPVALAMLWAACTILVARRRWPMAVGTVAGLALMPLPYIGPQLDDLSTPILVMGLAVFTLGRQVADLRGLVPLGVLVASLAVDMGATRIDADITDMFFVAVLLVPCFVFGRVMRLLADRNRVLTENAALLAQRQEAMQREAVAAERARMAREVHDVIAHSVSVMTVQAAAAQDLVRERPDEAVAALDEVQAAGRSALAETGRLLRLLRDSDNELGLAPERAVADLDGLVAEFRRGGLDVELTVDGALEDLPRGVAVSAYRVIREILTNGLKYAADRRLVLSVARREGELTVHADNRATVTAPGAPGGAGLGLVGMAERVAVHGGQLSHGREGDRFRLAVSLPLAAA